MTRSVSFCFTAVHIGTYLTHLQHLPCFADEAALLAVFRESLAVNFGDLGVSRSAMSLSGWL